LFIQLILLLRALELYTSTTLFSVILQIVAHTMAYTSSCINPLLYAFLSDNFRKAFYKVSHGRRSFTRICFEICCTSIVAIRVFSQYSRCCQLKHFKRIVRHDFPFFILCHIFYSSYSYIKCQLSTSFIDFY